MLPFFPSPYPDELFYGICARYHQRSGHTSVGHTLVDLFGYRFATVSVDFPTNIPSLVINLPPGTGNTLDHLLNAHTMLPLFMPFLPKDRAARILAYMTRNATGGNINMTIGATASAVPSVPFLRYCPSCLSEDERNHGEPYWHRSHQVSGVELCHSHRDRLVYSTVAVHGIGGKHKLIALSGVVLSGQTALGERDINPHHVWLAKSLYWLLTATPPLAPQGLEWLRSRYLHHLRRLGVVGMSARPDWQGLIRRFLDFYGQGFLTEVHSPLTMDRADNWLLSLLRKPRKAVHPLRHLLVMRFLGLEMEEFFDGGSKDVVLESTRPPETPPRSPSDVTGRTGKISPPLPPGEDLLTARRERWLQTCSAHPSVGVKEIRLADGADYSWLYRHDREWLRAHSPRKPHPPPARRVDWDERDTALAAQVISAASEIMSRTGRPVRVTMRAIGIQLGVTALLENELVHLPRAKAALTMVVESKEEFADRRLQLAAEKLKRQGESLCGWRLIRAAGLRPEHSNRLAEEIERLAT